MTLILALAARDGVVLASDGMATYQTNMLFEAAHVAQKLRPLDPCAMIAGVGMLSEIQNAERWLDANAGGKSVSELIGGLSHCIGEQRIMMRERYDRAFRHSHIEVTPQMVPYVNLVIAEWRGGQSLLVLTDHIGAFTVHEQTGFAVVGVGDAIAHAILRGLPVRDLALAEAEMLAVHIMLSCIGIAGGGVGLPISLWTISGTPGEERRDVSSPERIDYLSDRVAVWSRDSFCLFRKLATES